MGAQALILLKKDSPVLYIVGAQASILLKRDTPVLYIVGAHAPIFGGGVGMGKSVYFRFQVQYMSSCIRIFFSTEA